MQELPLGEYKKLAGDKIDEAVQWTLSLRAMLRTQYVAEMGGQVLEFVARLEQILPLLNSYAVQKTDSGAAENVQKLRDSLHQLTASCREHSDNVRCMDDLQYEILPVLKRFLKLLRK